MLCPNCLRRPTTLNNPMCSLCMGDKAKTEKKATRAKSAQVQKRTTDKSSVVQKRYSIPKISPKKAARERELKKVRDKKKEEVKWCESCGTTDGFISYSHILPVGMNQDLELNPENAIMQCIPCHTVWSNGSLEDKMKQRTFQHCVDVIMKLKPTYLNLLLNEKK